MPPRKSKTFSAPSRGASVDRLELPIGRRWRVFRIAFAALLIPMVLWALASPLGSVPDEPSHAIRAAAVVRGQVSTEAWSKNTTMSRADVPKYVAQMHERTCYAFKPEVTPACEVAAAGNQNAIVTTGSSAGINSPAYYAIVGLPTLFLAGDTALYAMRMVNVLLCAAALAAMIMQLSTLRSSRWATAAAVVAITPMVLFLSGSINPNAIEAASAGALFATLVALVRGPSSARILWERVTVVVLAVGLLVNTRSISLLWVFLIIAAALGCASWENLRQLIRRPPVWIMIVGSAALSLAALWWYANPPRYGADVAPAGVSSFSALVTMLLTTFDFSNGYVGVFGWVDTPSPSFSLIVWGMVIGALVIVALTGRASRERWVAAGFGAAMLLVPPLTEAVIAPQLGYIWQGRYMLAIFICFLIACGMAIDSRLPSWVPGAQSRPVLAVAVSLLAVGQVWSFFAAERRYAVGSAGSVVQMLLHPLWQPPLGWFALTALLALWAAACSLLVFRTIMSRGVAEVGTAPGGSPAGDVLRGVR